MKKQAAAYIHSLDGQAHYSGKTKTMFINDPRKGENIQSIEEATLNRFGYRLQFTLKTN